MARVDDYFHEIPPGLLKFCHQRSRCRTLVAREHSPESMVSPGTPEQWLALARVRPGCCIHCLPSGRSCGGKPCQLNRSPIAAV